MNRSFRRLRNLFAVLLSLATVVPSRTSLPAHASNHLAINCTSGWAAQNCTEVDDAANVFGRYVGHDEPSLLFYSNQAGAGNSVQYRLTLPTDPPTLPNQAGTGGTFNFQLHPAFWFGMAMCDSQSYPEQLSTCTPDSDSNIIDPATSPNHPGTAFMEMQFYPPGWVPWPAGDSCDATKWCAALTIDSLSEDPVNGTTLNATCAALTGLEYVNFAFITLDGTTQAPANPVQSTRATFTPDPAKDLFMNSGDQLIVQMHDTAHGLSITIRDLTTHQSGSMTASAANGFGQVKYAPAPSSECTNLPYDFHPMYSTSSEQTRVIWAAHSYNVAFSDEIGHFDYCNGPISQSECRGKEGAGSDIERADDDDYYCFPASASSSVQVAGCLNTNTGFDGTSYQPVWPDGNTTLHPTPIQFTSALVSSTNTNYDRVAFEADVPRIEASDFGGSCNRSTGAGCTLIPITDDGQPASFYPFFSAAQKGTACTWLIGNDIPGQTTNDFDRDYQYGSLLQLSYLVFGGGGTSLQRYNNFRQVLSSNPCPASG